MKQLSKRGKRLLQAPRPQFLNCLRPLHHLPTQAQVQHPVVHPPDLSGLLAFAVCVLGSLGITALAT